jgi:hypothetical protein
MTLCHARCYDGASLDATAAEDARGSAGHALYVCVRERLLAGLDRNTRRVRARGAQE